MPPLDDIRPKKKLRFKDPDLTPHNTQLFFFSFVQVPECAHCTLSFSALYMLWKVLIVPLYYTYVT